MKEIRCRQTDSATYDKSRPSDEVEDYLTHTHTHTHTLTHKHTHTHALAWQSSGSKHLKEQGTCVRVVVWTLHSFAPKFWT